MFSIEHLHTLRTAEIDKIVTFFRPGARVLEIGAGTGHQALDLSKRGIDITAIEIPRFQLCASTCFFRHRLRWPPHPVRRRLLRYRLLVERDGTHSATCTRQTAKSERVLRPNGYCVHVMPTHIWRFWTTLSAFPTAFQYAGTLKSQLLPLRSLAGACLRLARPLEAPFSQRCRGARDAGTLKSQLLPLRSLAGAWLRVARHLGAPFFQRRHGERGNIISELWLFHPNWWRRAFREDGFEIIRDEPMGLFYTGNMTFGSGLPLARREKLAKVLGSACHLYQMQPNSALRALHQGPTSAEDVVTLTRPVGNRSPKAHS